MADDHDKMAPRRRLYGRTKGHSLRAGQQALLDTLYPALAVPGDGPITAATLFGDDRPLHLEIGFGSGEHLADRADMLPDHGFIGAEPFINGVVGALGHIRDRRLTNVRLHRGDAMEVLMRLPDASVRFVYLLHPDPWRKARHAKRRFVNDAQIREVARVLQPGGEFRFCTDHVGYLRHALMVMQRHTDRLAWLGETPADFNTRPGGWSETRFGIKARAVGHDIWYFRYRRT